MDKHTKKIQIAPSLDELMSDFLPASNEAETAPVVIAPTAKKQSVEELDGSRSVPQIKRHQKCCIRDDASGIPVGFSKLQDITEIEKGCFVNNAHAINVSVSNDVYFALKAMSSHNCPQGLIISAVLRDFIIRHVEEIKALLYNSRSPT